MRVRVKIWFRSDNNGDLARNSDNAINSFTTQRGRENPVNGRIYTNITIRNGSGKGVILFEISTTKDQAAIRQNVEYIEKLRAYLRGREHLKIEKR